MRNLSKICGLLVAACTIVMATWQSPADAADLTTPEKAIAAYIDGASRQDFDAMMAVASAGRMAAAFDFPAHVDRLGMFSPSTMPMPASSSFLAEINRAKFTAKMAQQIQFLIYGLMASDEILNGQSVRMDAAAAAEFAKTVRTERLAGLSLLKTGMPNPTMADSERYKANMAKAIQSLGADEVTERIALLSFEGQSYVIGFNLLRYGKDWTVNSQSSQLAGTVASGVPGRLPESAFEAMIR